VNFEVKGIYEETGNDNIDKGVIIPLDVAEDV
jgi:hypothetical protein